MHISIVGTSTTRRDFRNAHSPDEEQFYDIFSFNDSVSTDNAISLLRQFAANDGRAVTFCGSGECTTHPGYPAICDAGHEAGLRIGLITNGSRLGRRVTAECVASTHTWVRIGLNAGTEATFDAITRDREDTFVSLLENVGRLRQSAIDPDFRIGFHYVITARNHREIMAAAHVAREAGAHYIRFEPELSGALGHATAEPVMDEVTAALGEAAGLATGAFEVSVPELDQGPTDRVGAVEGDFGRCHYSRFVTAVGADGNLYPCPQVHLDSRYRLGNVIDDGYAEVLGGGPRAEWEQSDPLCTDRCKSCFYRPRNELLELLRHRRTELDEALGAYALEVPSTLHADFV
ncbi:radical SAM protein [Streptomyces sp. NPDC026206]|uniref:radical SAM protein n=1 Tax=Streptomyces sp. NPDC026206 TaxID=3157089 RepID=UPI0033D496D6